MSKTQRMQKLAVEAEQIRADLNSLRSEVRSITGLAINNETIKMAVSVRDDLVLVRNRLGDNPGVDATYPELRIGLEFLEDQLSGSYPKLPEVSVAA